MSKIRLLETDLRLKDKDDILEQIKLYIRNPVGSFQIVSINPEILVIAQENQLFKKVVESSQIQIADGVGIVLAAKILDYKAKRVTGVSLMEEMLKVADKLRLRVVLIGGNKNLALSLSKCYSRAYPSAKLLGLQGISDIRNPAKEEEQKILSIVTDFKPHFLFAAFGSPEQELWLDRHKKQLSGIVCMGVGGAFDFLAGRIPRAPRLIQSVGFEWVFRLLVQPWRWRRQLRLIKFLWLVLKQKYLLVLGGSKREVR